MSQIDRHDLMHIYIHVYTYVCVYIIVYLVMLLPFGVSRQQSTIIDTDRMLAT